MLRTYTVFALISVLLISLFFSPAVKAVDKGGTLHCMEKESPDSYDPITSQTMPGLRLSELIFESLLCETSWGYEGRLAEEWEFSGDSLLVIFHLKPNVKWCEVNEDGEIKATQPFTAKDVLYTYQLIKNDQTDTDPYNRELLRDIKEPRVISDSIIEFRLRKKLIRPEESFTFKIVPEYKIKGSFVTSTDPFTHAPVGTGYYVFFKDWGKDKILKANSAYYGEPANIDKIEMNYYPDENILSVAAILTRDISAVIEARVQDIAKYQSSGQYDIRPYAPLSFHYIGYNLKNKLFTDKRVRQALTCAIDRERIIRDQFLDKGVVISGPYPPGSPLSDPDVHSLPFDTLMAKRLLKEAGYREVNGGWIKDGKELTFTLTVAAEQNDQAWSTAEHIRDYWKNVGIPIALEKVTKPTWWLSVYKNRDFEATYGKWNCDKANDIRPLFKTGTEKNYVSYSNPPVDSLIRLLDDITIPEERRSINYKLHKILAEDCPYTFLWTLNRYAAVSKSVKKSEMIHDFNFFTYINKWWIPEELQK